MKNSGKALRSILMLVMSALIFQNCGQTPLGSLGFNADEFNSSDDDSYKVNATNPYALLSSEQVYRSMASVTGIAPNTAIMTEYDQVSSVLSSGYDLRLVTSPLMIGSANLASRFCLETIAQETTQERFYAGIDFGRAAESNTGSAILTEDAFLASVESMAFAFWGRSPSPEEMQDMLHAKNEFLNEYTPDERRAVNSSTNLMLFTCTAMLVSLDAMTF